MIDGEAIREPYRVGIELKSERRLIERVGSAAGSISIRLQSSSASQQRAMRLDNRVFIHSSIGTESRQR